MNDNKDNKKQGKGKVDREALKMSQKAKAKAIKGNKIVTK